MPTGYARGATPAVGRSLRTAGAVRLRALLSGVVWEAPARRRTTAARAQWRPFLRGRRCQWCSVPPLRSRCFSDNDLKITLPGPRPDG